MAVFSRQTLQRWTLSLIAVLMLHGVSGFCQAVTHVLCVEAQGHAVVEQYSAPSAVQHAQGDCVDLAFGEAHEGHESASAPQLHSDAPQIFGLVHSLVFILPVMPERLAALPQTTGPPSPSLALVLSETTFLLI